MREEEEDIGVEEIISSFVNNISFLNRASNIIQMAKEGKVHKSDFLFLCRYVMATLTYVNAQCCGAVLAITVSGLKKAKKKKNSGSKEGGWR